MATLLYRLAGLALALVLGSVAAAAAEPPTVYLTFDDGPLIGTANALGVVQEERVPAGFFMIGKHVDADASTRSWYEAVKAEPLITLSNHSFSHANDNYHRFYASPACVVADFRKAVERLGIVMSPVPARLPGRNTFRLPGISRDDPAFARTEHGAYDAVGEAGFHLYGWDIEWLRGQSSPRESAENVISQITHLFDGARTVVPGRLILLMHDQMFQSKASRDKLASLISGLKAKGYAFGRIEDYLKGVTGLRIPISAREPVIRSPETVCDPEASPVSVEQASNSEALSVPHHKRKSRRHRKR